MEMVDFSGCKSNFDRVRPEPGSLWKKIHESDSFKIAFQGLVGFGCGIAFTAFVLPLSAVLATITIIGLLALGLSSPMLVHPKAAKIWKMVKNKLFGALTDLAHLPGAALITPLAFQPNPSFQSKEQKKTVVVFVHGFLHNKTCWHSLSKELQQKSQSSITEKDIYAINLGEPVTTQSIEHYSRFLATKLEQIRKKRGLDSLNVILDCHSMGGLVAGHFSSHFAEETKINVVRLISNGTPWHGTPVAHLGRWTTCATEMLPKHDFQKTVSQGIVNKNIGSKIYTIASKGDTIVPYRSALGSELNIPNENRFTLKQSYLGHLAMLHAKETKEKNIELILDAWNNTAN